MWLYRIVWPWKLVLHWEVSEVQDEIFVSIALLFTNLFHWRVVFFLCLSYWRCHNLKFAPALCGYAITWLVMEIIPCDGEQTIVTDSGRSANSDWNGRRNRVRWAPPSFMVSVPCSRGSIWLPFCLSPLATHAVSPSLHAAHTAIAAAASYPAHATMSEPLISWA